MGCYISIWSQTEMGSEKKSTTVMGTSEGENYVGGGNEVSG